MPCEAAPSGCATGGHSRVMAAWVTAPRGKLSSTCPGQRRHTSDTASASAGLHSERCRLCGTMAASRESTTGLTATLMQRVQESSLLGEDCGAWPCKGAAQSGNDYLTAPSRLDPGQQPGHCPTSPSWLPPLSLHPPLGAHCSITMPQVSPSRPLLGPQVAAQQGHHQGRGGSTGCLRGAGRLRGRSGCRCREAVGCRHRGSLFLVVAAA